MNIKEKLINLLGRSSKSVQKYLMPFVYSLILFIVNCYIIIFDSSRTLSVLNISLIIGIVSAVVLEELNFKFERIVSLVLVVLSYFLVNSLYNGPYLFMMVSGIIVFLVAIFLFLLYKKSANKQLLMPLIRAVVLVGLLTIVFDAGCLICALAFQFLIYDFPNFYKIYLIILCTNIVLTVNMFLALLPQDDEFVPSKALDFIINKIGLGLYLLLITILYVYFIKIVIARHLPNNRINIFASIALLFFVAFYLTNVDAKAKFNQLYYRYSGLLMIPIIIMQVVAVYLRVNECGLTSFRMLSISLNLIGYLFVFDSIFVHKIAWAILTAGLIVLLITVTPLNIIDLPNRNQFNILTKTLSKNSMLVDDEIVHNSAISKEDRETIISAYQYLRDNLDTLTAKQKKYIDVDFTSTYGFDDLEPIDTVSYHNAYYTTSISAFDIEGYGCLTYFDVYKEGESFMVENIDITNYLASLYNRYGDSSYEKMELVLTGKNYRIYFDYIDLLVDQDGNIVRCYCKGIYLR